MPKISLADQLDALKGKMSGLFSRAEKPAAEQAEGDASASSPSQVKRLAPLVVAVAVLGGGGYTYQADIMALIEPASTGGNVMPLPVARTPAPAVEETITSVISEPETSLEVMSEEVVEVAAAPIEESPANTGANDEMDLIAKKLQAMQELQAMDEGQPEEAAEFAMVMDEESPELTTTDDDMLVMGNNDDVVDVELTASDETNEPQPLNTASAETMQSNQWTLWQASNQWAVQVMAVQTKEYLTDFISQNELENGATYFEFSRDGNHYYALVVGVYNTHAEANEAAQTVAAEFNVKPWVRSMKSIQSAIEYDFNTPEPALALSQKF